MKRNFMRISLLAFLIALCGGLAVSAMLGKDAKAPVVKAPEVDKTATWDYSNATVMAETMALSGSNDAGTVKAVEDNGIVMTVLANGASFRDNNGNIQVRKNAEFRIPVVTNEDIVTVKGYPGYSYYSISGSEEICNTSENPVTTYKAKNSDVQRGYVSVVSTNDNNYFYSLSVQQMKPRELLNLTDAPATATFTFGLGTEKQTAEFNEPDYFLASKVTYGSGLVLDGKDNKSLDETWFNPESKAGSASDEVAVRFLIQPKFGLKFTPTKVSFKTTRFGTDGGALDIAWQNPDGTTVSLDTNKKPPRDNATPNVGEMSYDVTGAKADEGACGLVVYIYSLDHGKRIGFKDIVIEGTVSGQEVEVPMLESFTANGVTYAAEDVFEADGDSYVATVELAAAETMISASNPIAEATATTGSIGTITYNGNNDACTATIPVSLNDITINYVVNFVRKPIFTVTYYNTDSSVMGTQQVEKDAKIVDFAVDYTTAKAEEGFKVRGWFVTPTLGKKATVEDVVLDNMNLYAIATEIEEISTFKKYEFNLKDPNFYPEDHEAFSTENGYFHDTTHGWAFKNGDKIELLVGPKADVSVALCRYGYGTTIKATDTAGNEIASVPAKSADEIDGEVVSFSYAGQGGVITLNLESEGEMYFHSVKITNTSEVNYDNDGQWFYVKAGDALSLIDVIEAASNKNGNRDAERVFIYIPDGLYDLRETVLTNIYGHNISLIGQSMEGTIIRNAPHKSTEGIATTATLMNTGTNIYLQDLTIQNALDYYGALGDGLVGGRAVAWWDKGTNTVCKNVTLLSCQDTYYSNNLDGSYYWETSDIHGTVDFLCGEGTMFMENCTLTVEKRNANGKGECTLLAPATKPGNRYGYVFNNCFIKNYAEKYNLGRAWDGEPRAAYINTTVNDDAINPARWTANGMNVAAKEFVEYNTKNEAGNVVSPSSNTITFIKGDNVNTMETILTAEQAAEFTVDKVFPEWNPAELAKQVASPAATYKNGTVTWAAVEGASAYAIFCDGVLLAITPDTSYAVNAENNNANYTIAALNSMGGLSPVAPIDGLTSIDVIEAAEAEITGVVLYNMQGVRVDASYKGVVVKVATLSDGRTVTSKVINR